ncbi:MAG TPA: hypothetical protein DCX06_08125 [Opitutae bacterium]|nr:hypothetical protein [Opitutae bacterium]
MNFLFENPKFSELGGTALLALIVWLAYKDHESDFEEKYSTFWPRFWAPSIDELVLWPVVTLIPMLIVQLLDSGDTHTEFIFGIAYLSYFAYSIYYHTIQGATVGKRICKVRVVDAKTERPIGFKQAFLRDLIPFLFICGILVAGMFSSSTGDESLLQWIFMVFGIWFLLEVITMLSNEKRRALHDFIAGTVVVRADLWENERKRRRQMREERVV